MIKLDSNVQTDQWACRTTRSNPVRLFMELVKVKVYITPSETVKICINRISTACRQIPSDVIPNATTSVQRRTAILVMCLESSERQFEHSRNVYIFINNSILNINWTFSVCFYNLLFYHAWVSHKVLHLMCEVSYSNLTDTDNLIYIEVSRWHT